MRRIDEAIPRRWSALFAGLFVALAAVVALVAPGAARADITPLDVANMFGTETGDSFSAVFLNQIFGPLFPTGAGAGVPTVFSIIIGYFNVIVLVIGGLMFFYNVTVGIMQTAHEGSVLGQRWSSLWAPLRVVFAVGMLVPVPGLGGYNLSQAGIAYVVKGSTNVASAIWGTSAEMVIDGTAPITARQPMIESETVRAMYMNAACASIVNYQFAQAAGSSGTPLQVTFGRRLIGDVEEHVSRVSGSASDYQNEGICGSFRTPDLPLYISRILDEDGGIQGLPAAQKDAVKTRFVTMHTAVLRDLYNDMLALTAQNGALFAAVRDSTAGTTDIAPDLIAARNAANASLADGSSRILNLALGADRSGQASRQALKDRILGECSTAPGRDASSIATCYGEGWIGAGSWYMMMAQLNNEIASLMHAKGKVETGKYIQRVDAGEREIFIASNGAQGGFDGDQSELEATLMLEKFAEAYENSVIGMAALGETMPVEHLSTLSDAMEDDWLDKLGLGAPMQGMIADVISMTSPSNWSQDPMVGIVEIGNQMMEIGVPILTFAAISDASIFGWSAGSGISMVLTPLGMAMVAAGGMMSYILPLMPFIFWVLAVGGYFLLVVEAIVAVNLWALGHLRMDGEGISGEAGKYGWLMLLSLMVTPTLMVFGFLIGMVLFRVSSSLLDIGLNQAVTGLLGAGFVEALFAMIIYGIMIVALYMVILERSFALVSEFPGRVLRWMGADANLTKGEEDRARVAAGAGAAASGKFFGGMGSKFSEARRMGRNFGPVRGRLPWDRNEVKSTPPSLPKEGG